jgi:aminoglycoside phosphotransferase (APT) family kinase protein
VGLSPPALVPEEMRPALERWLVGALSADRVEVLRLSLMGGGAIQENHALDLLVQGGPWSGRLALVLRTTTVAGVPVSLARDEEFAVLSVAHRAGMRVPEPLVLCRDRGVIGRPFYLMRRLEGVAPGRLLVRDPALPDWGDALALSLGRELARLHRVVPPVAELGFLAVPKRPAEARIAFCRAQLDRMDEPQPVLEWALRWLELHPVEPAGVVLCHGDFRTGNYLVQDGMLQGVLDWEFACWSDPLEDLGWFCARCWRFGNVAEEAGGIGAREALYRGYEAESGRTVPRDRVPWWEVLATVRWAVIALQQAERHLSGREPSLELALTGHVVPELEVDMLRQIEAMVGVGGG